MGDNDAAEGTSTGRQSKVVRVIRTYGLDGMGDELVDGWTGEGDDQRSLRELADDLNQAVLRAAMADAGMNPLAGEVENLYRLLTDEETSAGDRTDAETTLEREGIAVDELRRDFVSHQAVYTYLTEYRDVEYQSRTPNKERIENTVDTVRRLQSRLTAVSEKSLQKLRDAGLISLGDFSVLVDVRVFCEDCNTQRGIVDVLTGGGCDCDQ